MSAQAGSTHAHGAEPVQDLSDPITDNGIILDQFSEMASEAERETELTYQIPAKDYQTAVMASPSTNAAFWSHRLYKSEKANHPAVLYCTSFETAEKQARLFLDEPVLGFDLEWEPWSLPTIKQNVSLIQIASEDKIGLFQLACFSGDTAEKLLPPTLRTILESPRIIKAGVNIAGDATRLRQWLNVSMQGSFELSHLYKVVKFSANEASKVNFKPVSLAAQVQDILSLPLKKDANRVSAWSMKLSAQQTDYAASDAYAGFRLYHALEKQRKRMKPMPPRPSCYETNAPLILGDGTEVYKSSARKALAIKPAKVVVTTGEESENDEFFDAAEELNANESGSERVATNPEAKSKKLDIKPTIPDTLAFRLADDWQKTYFATKGKEKVFARPNELRAYHLWHQQGFEPKDVAAYLKHPPLSLSTVASYTMQVIKVEGLPFDRVRARDVLRLLPHGLHMRFESMFKKSVVGKGG